MPTHGVVMILTQYHCVDLVAFGDVGCGRVEMKKYERNAEPQARDSY